MCDFKGSLRTLGRRKHLPDSPNSGKAPCLLFFFLEFFSFCLQCISSFSSDSSVLVHLILHHPHPPHHHLHHVSQASYYSSLLIDTLCFEYLSCSVYRSCSCQNDTFLKTHQPLPVAFCRDGRQTKRCIHFMAFLADDANQP